MIAQALVGCIRVYQWTLRPFIGAHCRFEPTCSAYGIEALRRHGAAAGTAMTVRRVLRCNPWCDGGIDPVPSRSGPSCPCSSCPCPEKVTAL